MDTKILQGAFWKASPIVRANWDIVIGSAWNFAQAILWNDQRFSTEEISAITRHISRYFDESGNFRKAFVAFCERIILTDKYLSAHPDKHLPWPTVWFNCHYQDGFASSKTIYDQVENQRQKTPGYLKHITTVAKYYYRYALKPSETIFRNCRKQLLKLRANKLLQQFYSIIVHHNYLRP